MVTRYLAEVERWLGARLLHRTTRRVSLDRPGRAALRPDFRRMLAIGDELRGELAADDPEPHGVAPGHRQRVVRARATWPPRWPTSCRRYPPTQVELLLVDRVVNLMEERVDVAVRISPAQIDPALIARRLATCRSVLCAAPAYLPDTRHADRGRGAGRAQLPDPSLRGQEPVAPAARWALADRVAVGGNISANEASLLLEAVHDGAGCIAMLPTYQIAPLLRSGELIEVLPDYQPGRARHPCGVRLAPAAARYHAASFLDFLAECFAEPANSWRSCRLRALRARRAHEPLVGCT